MAVVPTLARCITYGETVGEAISMAKEAVELFIEELNDRGEEIPSPRALGFPALLSGLAQDTFCLAKKVSKNAR